MAVLTDTRRAERAQEMDNALASGRMEGLEPSPGAMAIFQRFVDGELTMEQMSKAIGEFAEREYGPVRLPGN